MNDDRRFIEKNLIKKVTVREQMSGRGTQSMPTYLRTDMRPPSPNLRFDFIYL